MFGPMQLNRLYNVKLHVFKSSGERTYNSDNNKHLLDETESNIQFIASGQGNIGLSKAEPNIILYGCNKLDVNSVKSNKCFIIPKKSDQIS